MSGTTLRPILASMNDDLRKDFASDYINALREAYCDGEKGKILLRYKRLFIIGMR